MLPFFMWIIAPSYGKAMDNYSQNVDSLGTAIKEKKQFYFSSFLPDPNLPTIWKQLPTALPQLNQLSTIITIKHPSCAILYTPDPFFAPSEKSRLIAERFAHKLQRLRRCW